MKNASLWNSARRRARGKNDNVTAARLVRRAPAALRHGGRTLFICPVLFAGFAAWSCGSDSGGEPLAIIEPDCPVLTVGSTGPERHADLALGAGGDILVVWESDRDEDGLFQIRGMVLAPDGSERVGPFTVNSTSAGQQFRPAVAMDGTGRFVVVWEDDNNRNGIFQLHARGFHPDGSERFPQFTVNFSSAGQQLDPDIAMEAGGGFVVVWEDDGDSDGLFQIRARGFGADGAERIPQFTANASSAGQQIDPVVAMDPNGNFVVAWADDGDSDGLFQIRARGFGADGAERIPQFTVNVNSAGQQIRPAIAMDGGGSFIVLWDDDRDRDGDFQVHARGFHPDGTERLARFTVNVNNAGQQIHATVAMNAAGDFAAAWEEDRDNDGEFHIRLRGFQTDGTENFAHTKVDCLEPAQHLDPVIGIDPAGRIVVFWAATPDLRPTRVLGRMFP